MQECFIPQCFQTISMLVMASMPVCAQHSVMQGCVIPRCFSNNLNVSGSLNGGPRSALCDAIMLYSTMCSYNFNVNDGLHAGLRSALCDARMRYSTMFSNKFNVFTAHLGFSFSRSPERHFLALIWSVKFRLVEKDADLLRRIVSRKQHASCRRNTLRIGA